MRKIVFFFCLFLFLLEGKSVQALTSEDIASEQQLKQMTLEEKIGQMLIIDFAQTIGGGQTVVNESLIRVIEQIEPGGMVLFKDNIQSNTQTRVFTTELQQLNDGIPFFIGVDQEGGELVNRLPFLTEMPGNMALGASGDLGLTKRVASVLGEELSALGFNMNFAPVVDINSNPHNPIIGVRSFGEDPQSVAKMSKAFMDGLHDKGIIAVAKHFPGHGDVAVDSHKGLPIGAKSIEQLQKKELIPFKYLIDNGIQSIMTAHIAFPAIEKTNLPASLSPKITTKLLREDLGFTGVIMTDALNMQAVASVYSPGDAAIAAVTAGADVLLMPKEALTVKRALVQAVKSNVISEERIDQSVNRILTLKAQQLKKQRIVHERIQSHAHREVEKEAARKSIVVIKSDSSLPLHKGEKVSLILDGENSESLQVLTSSFEQAGIVITTEQDADRLIYLLQTNRIDQVIHRKLQMEKRPVVVISTTAPYHYHHWAFVSGFISTFSHSKASLQGVSDYLAGVYPATGCLPVSIYQASGDKVETPHCGVK